MTALLRAFLVDDEPLSLKRLARLLEASGRVAIVGRATDPAKALAQLTADAVDVVFLDIHMPGLSGLQVAERLPPNALVVFTTAYEHHAVAAFEVNAVDYLLKPIVPERLHATLDRLAVRRDDPARAGLRETLERLTSHLRGATHLSHLASRVGERVHLIPVEEVTHVFARDRATYAATAAAEHMLDAPIIELERKLDPARFFRIHRGALVNVTYVGELHRVRPLKERLGLA